MTTTKTGWHTTTQTVPDPRTGLAHTFRITWRTQRPACRLHDHCQSFPTYDGNNPPRLWRTGHGAVALASHAQCGSCGQMLYPAATWKTALDATDT